MNIFTVTVDIKCVLVNKSINFFQKEILLIPNSVVYNIWTLNQPSCSGYSLEKKHIGKKKKKNIGQPQMKWSTDQSTGGGHGSWALSLI